MKRSRNALLSMILLALFAGPAGAQVAIDPEGMMATVKFLADEKFRGRGIGSPELDQVAAFIATKFTTEDVNSTTVQFTRPLCAHPRVARYVSGDVNSASSFACGDPRDGDHDGDEDE